MIITYNKVADNQDVKIQMGETIVVVEYNEWLGSYDILVNNDIIGQSIGGSNPPVINMAAEILKQSVQMMTDTSPSVTDIYSKITIR